MQPTCPLCSDTGFEIRTGEDGVSTAVPCDCARRSRGERLLRSAGIPRRYEHCTLDSFDTHDPTTTSHAVAKRIALDWVERWPVVDHGLLFLGKPGTGKTHLAVGIARELAGIKGAHVVFCEQRQLLKEIQATFDAGVARSESDVLRPLLDADLLVLDDLGAGRTTAWSRDVVHDIIVQRYNDDAPLVLTSNHPLGDERDGEGGEGNADLAGLTLRDRLGDAIVSRLYEMCRIVTIEGRDFRRGVLHMRTQY